MKHLIHNTKKVLAYIDAFSSDQISPGAQVVFTGTESQCKLKVKELGLDYGDFDLAQRVVPPCSPRQIRLWLLGLGVTESMILAQINSIPDAMTRAATLIEYEYALSFERSHQFVDSVGSALGLSSDQIDEGFIYASTI
jgi:hypothetical protein